MTQQWKGTAQELEQLRRAVELHCGCARPLQAPAPTCPAHSLLMSQPTLDHLLFVYRTRRRFLAYEFQAD